MNHKLWFIAYDGDEIKQLGHDFLIGRNHVGMIVFSNNLWPMLQGFGNLRGSNYGISVLVPILNSILGLTGSQIQRPSQAFVEK